MFPFAPVILTANPGLLGPLPSSDSSAVYSGGGGVPQYNVSLSATIMPPMAPSQPVAVGALPFGYPSNTALYVGLLSLLKVVGIWHKGERYSLSISQDMW